MIEYWPSIVIAVVVGVIGGGASGHAVVVLPERSFARNVSIFLFGVMLVGGLGAGAATIAGAPAWVANVATAVVGVIFLYGFAHMTRRARAFHRLARPVLDPGTDDRDRAARELLTWLESQRDGGELAGDAAEAALVLLGAGRVDDARTALGSVADDSTGTAAERAKLAGVRALLAHVEGDDERAQQLLAELPDDRQDFVSMPVVAAYRAYVAALGGDGERALSQLVGRAEVPQNARAAGAWARIHALAANGDDGAARDAIRSLRDEAGVAALVPLVHISGPASKLARAELS